MKSKLRLLLSLTILLLLVNAYHSHLQAQCALLPPVLSVGHLNTPNGLCSPVSVSMRYDITFSAPLAAGPNYVLLFIWGDGSPNTAVTLTPGSASYSITRVHAYPANSDCEYNIQMFISVNSAGACGPTRQSQLVTTWRTDEFNGGNVQMVSPVSGTNVHEVCEGANISVIFDDQSVFNCNSVYPANHAVPPGSIPIVTPNEQVRWQQIVYNTPNGAPRIPNVSVDGVLMPAGAGSNYQDPRGVFMMPPLVVLNDPRRRDALVITAPGGFGAGFPVTGDEFEITVRYWNACNPYDNPLVAGPPADLINGDFPPVEATAIIRIIDSPPSPVVPNRDICSGDSRTLTVTAPVGGQIYKWWTNAAATISAGPDGTSFTPTNAQAPAGQRTHFWVTTEVGPALGSCRSAPTEVTLLRRAALTSPTPISGPTNLCPNTSYTFSVPTGSPPNPPNVTITDPIGGNVILATDFFWTVPGSWTINSGQNTNSINITTGASAAGTVSVVNRYETAPLCPSSPATSLAVNVRARPTVNITPDPVNICEGTIVPMDGNPSTSFGSITSHTWGGSTAILDATNIQQPNIIAGAASGTYGLTYFVTADFGGGVFCSSTVDNSAVNISANTAPASTGPDQFLCSTLSSNPMGGSNPAPGTGTWSFVSSVPARPAPNISNINDPNATITILAGNEGAYTMRWTVVNGSCTSSADIVVDLGSNPTDPDAGPAQFICGESATLAGNTPIIGSGMWSVVSGPGACVGPGCPITIATPTSPTSGVTLNGPGFTYGAYTLRWTITSGTCPAETDDVIITFNQAATVSAMADFNFCLDAAAIGTPIPLTGTIGGGAVQGRWERVTGSGTIQSSGAAIGSSIAGPNINDSYIPVAGDFAAGSITVRLVALDPDGAGPAGPCVSVTDDVIITKDLLPTAANAGGNFSTCDPTINLAATAANNGGTGTWSIGNALYYETFTYANGTGLFGPNPHATLFTHGSGWTITAPSPNSLLAPDDYLRVESNVMEARDVNDELVWRSPSINITAQPNVTVSIQLAETGTMDAAPLDYIRAFYRLNGAGPEIPIGNIDDDSAVDGVFTTFTVSGITGTSLEVIVRTVNNANDEFYRFDNVFVSGSGGTLPLIADINNPTSSVSNLPVGTTTFTWTVTSALGVCSSSNAQVDVTRHATPVNNNQTPALCEDVPTGGTATVTLAFLTGLNDAITGIPSSTGRTVQFFTDPARTIPYPVSASLANTDVVYTIVTSTDVSPNCTTDGTIVFTINSRPAALDQNPEYCEDLPVGSNTKAGINLTLLDNAVKNGVVANTVAWFSDAGLTIPVPVPTNVTANGGDTFFAQVTDGNGCTDDARIDIQLNPIPSPNALIGPTNVCASATAVNLYQLTTTNPGFTYTWNIPDPPFDQVLGGGVNDFLLLLSFPVIVSPGQDISVIETSDKGCVGQPNILNITVEGSPPAITIVDASLSPGPGTVCENEAGVVYSVSNLANTTYAWTVPPGSSIIAGQGTNQITVNFGTIGGLISVVPTTSTGCAGTPDDYSVAINPRPALDILSNTVCSDSPSGITLSGTGAATFNITNVTVPPGLAPASRPLINGALPNEIVNDIFTNTTGGSLTVQYTVVPVSASGCQGAAQIVNLTVRPEPVLAPGLNDVICSTTDAVGVVLSVASGSFPADQYEVFAVNNPSGLVPVAGNPTTLGVFTSAVLLDDKWENTTGAPATIEYYIRPINSGTGCVGDPPIAVMVTVNPEPVVAAMVPETICSGDSPATIITPSIAGSTFTWTVVSVSGLITGNTNGTGPSGSAITDVLINNGAVAGSVTYAITPTGPAGVGSCSGKSENLVVNVNPSPTANSISQTVCSDTPGGNTFAIDLTSLENTVNGGGGVTFTWSENISMVPPIATPTAYTLTNGVPVFVEVDNGQCTKVATVLYTINPSPSVTVTKAALYNGFEISCNGASDGQLTAVPADGVGPYLFSINGGGSFFTTGTFNGLSVAGSPYVVRVRDANSCIVDSAPITFTEPTALSAVANITSNYNGQHISCQAASDGEVTVTPAGGTGTGTYTFSILELPGNTTGNASGIYTGLRAGVYTFVVRDANNCQFVTTSVTVVEPSPITATAVLTSPVSCNGNSDGVITVTAAGGTLAGPTYTFTLIQPPGTINGTGIFTGLAAGNYTVNVSDGNGCIRTSNTVSVTQPSVLTAFASVTSNYNGAKISCPGANDAEITAIANGGNGGYSYVLDQDPGNMSGATTGVFTNVGPGTFTITVTDAGTCSVTSLSVTVTDPSPIVASAIMTGTISCNGGNDGQITVSALGGTGAYSFEQINPAGPTNATGIFSGLAQGTYDFEVTDLNGCSDVVTLILNEPSVVTAVAAVTSNYNGAQVSCNGASNGVITVTAGGGTGSLTYVFDQFVLTNTTGQLTGVFTGVPAGVGYTFTVRDSKNCSVITVPINITEPTVVAASGTVTSNYNGEDISCVGASDGQIGIIANGGTGLYTYKLDQVPSNTTGDGSGVYTGLSAGIYTVTARDVNNCFIVTAPITITSPTAITASAAVTSNYNGRQVSCNGASDGIITVTAGGGVGGFTYVLSPAVNATGAASGVFTGLPAGTYTITVTDLNLCQRVTASVTISEPAVVAPSSTVTSNYNGEDISCVGSSDGTITVSVSGGTAPYTYSFVEIPGNTSGQSTGIFTGIPAGTYTFNVLDINNCPATTLPVTITPPAPLSAVASVTSNYNGEQISCNGLKDASITITPAGGTGTKTFVFDQDLANASGNFSGTYSNVGAGTGYTFTVTDFNGCPFTTVPINVTEPNALSAALNASSDFNGFDISCFNLTDGEVSVISLVGGTGSPSFLLMENPGNTTGQTSGVFTGLRAGTYRVRVTDDNFCTFTTPAIPVVQPTDIDVQIAITSNYNGFDISCMGASDGAVSVTTISGGATATSVTYVINPAVNTSGDGSGVYTGLVSGLYTITATDANNCSKQSLPVVMLDPLPLFEGIVGLDKSVCLGGDPTAFTELAPAFGGIGNYAYQWRQSTDNVTFSNVLGANSATFDPPAVPQTTYYKRQITSGTCLTMESNTVTVTVNPLPTATLAPSKTPVCEGDFFLLNFTFTGQAPFFFDYNDGTIFTNDRLGATNTPVPVLNYTNTTTYTVTEVRDFNGCVAPVLPAPVTVPVIKINPNFTITSPAAQCSGGVFTFDFIVDPDVDYTWTWGDGQTDMIPANSLPTGSQSINHTYTSMVFSGTSTLPVILTAINNVQGCGPKQTNQSIQIYPNILINLVPDANEICGGDDIRFNNLTQGGTTHHWFYREQGVVEMRDERTFVAASTQTFVFNNTTTQNPITYELVYEVSNANCAADTVIEVMVYREVAADFDKGVVPPFVGGIANMTFTNTSVPIDGAEFLYEWDFGNASDTPPTSGIGPFNINYTSPGTKTVTLVATNLIAQSAGLTCFSQYQETFDILLPPLLAAFEYSPQGTCFPANISITENFATGDQYTWRLFRSGQSSPILISNDTLPTFRIVSPGRYMIFLETRNSITGQTETANNLAVGNNTFVGDLDPNDFSTPIDIFDVPFAMFEALPTTVFVPDEELRTFNSSISPTDPQNSALTYPIDYKWYFGDGTDTVFSEFEPRHFFQNEGNYDVSLIAFNDHGNGVVCADTMIQRVTAKAQGFTRVPNAFTPNPGGPTGGFENPGSPSRNDVFLPIMKGIKEFKMQIFDRWGNLVFQSIRTDQGWDGYDRNGILMPAGVYVYKLELRLANDQRTTQVGDVTLIR